MQVRAKKHLGQHFLTDKKIARRIADGLNPSGRYATVLEIGPGKGILTDWLLQHEDYKLYAVDVDQESIVFLHDKYPDHAANMVLADFLKLDISTLFVEDFAVIGNFPYNISSQILFKVLEERSRVPELVGMFQKEVAERICASPSSKEYGILSVLVQAFYKTSYLFTVNPGSFFPAPKVKSGVLKMVRRENFTLDCDEKLFFKIVKAGFNQRRKMLRNALASVAAVAVPDDLPFANRRAEMLSVAEFVELTQFFMAHKADADSFGDVGPDVDEDLAVKDDDPFNLDYLSESE